MTAVQDKALGKHTVKMIEEEFNMSTRNWHLYSYSWGILGEWIYWKNSVEFQASPRNLKKDPKLIKVIATVNLVKSESAH